MKRIITLIVFYILCDQPVEAQISSSYQWTWINGDNTTNNFGVYGQKGMESPTNKPGARGYACNWMDANGNLWLFGGYGYANNNTQGDLNDLWKYNPSTNQWTWIAGNNTVNAPALRGELGQEGPNFTPSARQAATAWVDATGTELYLFGGYTYMYYSDVWVFNTLTNQWRWIKGTMVNGQEQCTGQALGDPGQFAAGVWPTCRAGMSAATAGSVAYLFGGFIGNSHYNELFQFADSNYPASEQKNQWAYLSSTLNSVNQAGRYRNTVPKPGSRNNAMSFLYYNGSTYDYYVFGGSGYSGVSGSFGQMNDLWRYSGLDLLTKQPVWEWVHGDTIANSLGKYGALGVPNSSNVPQAREYGSITPERNGKYILFGGGRITGFFNDLWSYEPQSNTWTWLSGSNGISAAGTYGTKGIQQSTNMISARTGHNTWITSKGEVYIFGGQTLSGKSNDLWKFSPVDIPPTTTLSPADDAIGIPIFTDLVLTFSEPVSKGTGSITIKQNGANPESIVVGSNQVNLSENDTKVTINPATDFGFESAVTVEIPAGVFEDKTGNDFAGTLANTWNFTTLPIITVEKGVNSLPENPSSTEFAGTVNYPPDAIQYVIIISKDITRNTWRRDTMRVDANNLSKFTGNLSLPSTQKDEIGIEYYFEVITTSGQKVANSKQLINLTYSDQGLPIPLVFGSQVKDYQIVSIPLDLTNKNVTAVLEELGTYNERKWRLYSYDTGKDELIEFKQPGFTTLEPGKGYLLIVKDQIPVNTGSGSTLRHNSDNPYTLTLKRGWNLIGNPYNINLSWEDIEKYNGKLENQLNLPGISNLKVWAGEKGYEESDRLDKFSGGIVYCDCTDGDVILKLPVERNTTYNGGRLAAEETKPRHYAGSVFETNFTLYTKELSYGLAGLGMHPEASAGKDKLDEAGLPRMPQFLQVNFAHPEYFYGRFTKDMAPVEENRIWEFTAETNLTAQEATLAWENYFATSSNKQLLLYDIAAEKVIDMKTQSSYRFELSKERKFRVYYGDAVFVEENLKLSRISLFANSPNPFSESTTISFAFPPSQNRYQVQIEIFDINGKKVATLVEGQYPSGFHQLNWDGRGSSGQPLSTGMYVGKVRVVSDKGSQLFSLKMIRK